MNTPDKRLVDLVDPRAEGVIPRNRNKLVKNLNSDNTKEIKTIWTEDISKVALKKEMAQENENKMIDKTHKFDNSKVTLDREKYLNKSSLFKSLKQSEPKEQGDKSKPRKNDPLYERMTSLYSTVNEWISDSKNALSSSPNSVTKCNNTQNPKNHPEFRETPEPTTHGDQAEITESRSRSIDLIDFNTEIENGETYFTHAQMPQNKRINSSREKDVESEIERSVNKAIKHVRKIGDMVRSISEMVQPASSSSSSDIAAKIKRVLQLVHQLKDEIPGNVQLLDSICQIEKVKYQKEWGVISKNLDEMKILAKTIQSTLAGLH